MNATPLSEIRELVATLPPLRGCRGRPGPGEPAVPRTHPGNGAAYVVRRLLRDHPGVLAALLRGEYRSLHQAAVAAGFFRG